MRMYIKRICSIILAMFYGIWFAPVAQAYSFDMIVPDVRQPSAVSGGSACPVRSHQLTAAGSIAGRWSTAPESNPVTILTQKHTTRGELTEIEQGVAQALAGWDRGGGKKPGSANLTPP